MLLERISEITQRWFLSEEALFSVFCTHRVAENSGMKCHIRVGKGVIEVNPELCDDITDKELEERLCVEVIRILPTLVFLTMDISSFTPAISNSFCNSSKRNRTRTTAKTRMRHTRILPETGSKTN